MLWRCLVSKRSSLITHVVCALDCSVAAAARHQTRLSGQSRYISRGWRWWGVAGVSKIPIWSDQITASGFIPYIEKEHPFLVVQVVPENELVVQVVPKNEPVVQVVPKNALQGTWLTMAENQLFCLLGPNGAGKSTTINCLTGTCLGHCRMCLLVTSVQPGHWAMINYASNYFI